MYQFHILRAIPYDGTGSSVFIGMGKPLPYGDGRTGVRDVQRDMTFPRLVHPGASVRQRDVEDAVPYSGT